MNDQDKTKEELIRELQELVQENTTLKALKEKRADELIIADQELAFQEDEKEKRAAELVIANKELIFQSEEKEKRADELAIADIELAFQKDEKVKRAAELIIANKELIFQSEEKEKRADELIIADKELAFQQDEKEKRATELVIANKELIFQSEEKEKRAAELIIANKELAFQNKEKEKRAAELIIANKKLILQNEEKEKRAAELIIANEELIIQNKEKETKAVELINANEELIIQSKEKEKRATELVLANKELAFQNEEKVKRAAELIIANKELAFQNEEKEKRAAELIIANEELIIQSKEKEKRAAELIVANEELIIQNEEKDKRAKVEEALRETNEYLENLINYANAPIIVWDTQFNITRFNKSFESITGRTEKDVIGKSLETVFPFTRRESSMGLIKETLGGKQWEVVEIDILHIDGSVRTLLWNSATIMSADGKSSVSTIAQGQDITERKRVEEELQESQKKYSSLYETAPVGIFRTKIDGSKILEINNTICEILGFSKEEMLSQPSAIRWADPNQRNEILQIMKEHGVANNFDADILKKDGSRISCLLSMKIFMDEGYIEGFLVDINERKHAEDAVRQSRKEIDSLFEASPMLISFIGFDGYFKRLNPAWVNTLGYTMDKLLSVPFIEFVHPDDRESTNAEAAKLAQGQRTIQFDNRYRCNDGSYRWLSWSVIPDTNEKLLYAVARDITERKHSEQEIQKLNTELEQRVTERTAQLEATNKELEAFSYSVSHDLRAPLRHINGFVDLLLSRFYDPLPDKARHYLDNIADSSRQMGKLIDDLLQFSRTGRQEMRKTDLDMNNIVQEVLAPIEQDNSERNIEWRIATLPHVYGDQALLRLVWTNLLSNAAKFTRTRGKTIIEIRVKDEKDAFIFSIRDNGMGFDMQYAQKLFGVFQRLHPTAEFEGTGIGLANVKRIIVRHGGRTWAEAEPDKGATFYFSLPKNKED